MRPLRTSDLRVVAPVEGVIVAGFGHHQLVADVAGRARKQQTLFGVEHPGIAIPGDRELRRSAPQMRRSGEIGHRAILSSVNRTNPTQQPEAPATKVRGARTALLSRPRERIAWTPGQLERPQKAASSKRASILGSPAAGSRTGHASLAPHSVSRPCPQTTELPRSFEAALAELEELVGRMETRRAAVAGVAGRVQARRRAARVLPGGAEGRAAAGAGAGKGRAAAVRRRTMSTMHDDLAFARVVARTPAAHRSGARRDAAGRAEIRRAAPRAAMRYADARRRQAHAAAARLRGGRADGRRVADADAARPRSS